ncbi:T9SS type A sorting domain-containing protein [Bizionia sp. M204]|uniref:T9SS type A sorting domain-containing protein n=1 Tax=Bizionia sp. M204 TaxID=2675331 RepID=UPI0020695496|nr:T9SS type A sorting domain-containing protein [Bizionia sp. M204]UPS90531.1 T9SS type A sorting domain-containing protein [Bizionia sp. M204]
MKKTLLLLSTIVTSIGFAQSPINDFFSIPMSSYAIVESTPALDQSASGAGLTWNFTNLTAVGTNTDTYAAPDAGQLSLFPGTTEVLTITTLGSLEVNNILAKEEMSGVFSFTGVTAAGIELNYNLNNALLGTFPLAYTDTTSDPVAGSFSSDAASGDFTGTITTSVDAYGTLNMNDVGEGAYSGNVTRLKVVQDLTLTVVIFNGSVTQTSYYYYDNSNGNLVFRSNTAEIVFAFAGINETITLMESFLTNPLTTPSNNWVEKEFQVIPNPVNDVLNISYNAPNTIQSIRVSDLNGRLVLSAVGSSKTTDVSSLQSGLYIVAVQTEGGLMLKKFLKK